MQRGAGLFLPEPSCCSFLCSLLLNCKREQEGGKFEKEENDEILALQRISGVANSDGSTSVRGAEGNTREKQPGWIFCDLFKKKKQPDI